jgi:hypothetical protein
LLKKGACKRYGDDGGHGVRQYVLLVFAFKLLDEEVNEVINEIPPLRRFRMRRKLPTKGGECPNGALHPSYKATEKRIPACEK